MLIPLLLLSVIAVAKCNFWEESGLVSAETNKSRIDFDVSRGENGPSTSWQASVAGLGLELVPAGETYPYHAVFKHLVVLKKPDIKDYEPMLETIKIRCQQFNLNIKEPSANQTEKQKRIYNETVSAYQTYNRLFYRRCNKFERVVRGAFTRDLNRAFSELMPVNRGELDDLIENALHLSQPMLVPDASLDEQRQILEHFELASKLSKELSPLNAEMTTVENEQGNVATTSTEVPVEPTTQFPSESATPFTSAPLPTSATITVPVSPSPVDGVSKVTENEIFSDFLSDRKKRQTDPVSLITAITSLLIASSAQASAGVALARQETIMQQVEELISAKLRTDRDTVVAAEELLGISELNSNDTQTAMLSLTQTQGIQDVLGKEIEHISFALARLNKKTEVSVAVLSNLIQQLDLSTRVQFILYNMRQRLSNYELAMNALRAGYLPTQFVDYNRLKDILLQIEASLPVSLYLGIDYSDIDKFYTQRLAKFTVHNDRVILRLMVPLSRTPALKPDQLFLANTLPVPLPDKWRKKYNVHPDAISPKIQLNLKSAYWVFREGKLIGVTSKNKMICEEAANEMICMSFNIQPNNGKSRCIQSFMDGDVNRASNLCDFTIVDAVYAPVPISNGSYVCHRSRFIEFQEVCSSGTRRLTVNSYAALFNIPKNCMLKIGDQDYPSFFNESLVMNHTFDYSIEGRDIISISPIAHIQTYEYPDLKPFEYNRSERVLFTHNTELINQKVMRVRRAVQSMQGTINQMEDSLKLAKRPQKINFKAADTFIFDILVLVLVITGIRRLRFPALFGLCIPHVIILNPADAIEIPSVNGVIDAINSTLSLHVNGKEDMESKNITAVLPAEGQLEYTFDLSRYDAEDILALCRLMIVVAAVVCSILQRSLFVTVISTLKGIVISEDNDHRFFLLLSFKRPYHCCWRFYDQLVVVTIPLVTTIPRETVRVEIARSRFTCTIKKKTGFLSVPEEFEIRGYTVNNCETFKTKLKLRIPLNTIAWAMNEKPKGINQTFAGRATIEVKQFSRQLKLGHPSRPIVKVTQM